MKKERFKVVPSVYVILQQEGKILLSLGQNTGYADGFYGLFAGHLDGNESARQGLIREVKEEIGINILEQDLELKLTMHRLQPDREAIDLFFVADHWQGQIINNEPEKCGGLEFFAKTALPDNIVPYLKDAFLAIEHGRIYAEYGWL